MPENDFGNFNLCRTSCVHYKPYKPHHTKFNITKFLYHMKTNWGNGGVCIQLVNHETTTAGKEHALTYLEKSVPGSIHDIQLQFSAVTRHNSPIIVIVQEIIITIQSSNYYRPLSV